MCLSLSFYSRQNQHIWITMRTEKQKQEGNFSHVELTVSIGKNQKSSDSILYHWVLPNIQLISELN